VRRARLDCPGFVEGELQVGALLNLPIAVGLAAVILLTVLINVGLWRDVKLVPIASESAAAAQKINWLLAGVYALFSLLH
jgi:hypothetical protein